MTGNGESRIETQITESFDPFAATDQQIEAIRYLAQPASEKAILYYLQELAQRKRYTLGDWQSFLDEAAREFVSMGIERGAICYAYYEFCWHDRSDYFPNPATLREKVLGESNRIRTMAAAIQKLNQAKSIHGGKSLWAEWGEKINRHLNQNDRYKFEVWADGVLVVDGKKIMAKNRLQRDWLRNQFGCAIEAAMGRGVEYGVQ